MSLTIDGDLSGEIARLSDLVDEDVRQCRQAEREAWQAKRDAKMIRDALDVWLDWLHACVLPRNAKINGPERLAETYETVGGRNIKGNTEHGDPVLNGLIAIERSGWSYAVSLDNRIMALGGKLPLVVLGMALKQTQHQIAGSLGWNQATVSRAMASASRVLICDIRSLENKYRKRT